MESATEQYSKKDSTGTLSAVAKVMGDTISSVVDTLSEHVTLTKTIEDMCYDQYKLEHRRHNYN